ncbi:hypothetical protein N7520_006785 [Penicillium odoratum]|uniref:uncharacterized protein n=1 Tax=Penicillium odoratum TaxID=1167516 RepID=UPI002548070E|nr:uncharacterized protein N7520_006785 [Penicillium odoratum]KAJ5759629.1 hypothetical protein N7520_006785 [Penicillium odoratum]
MAYTIFPSPGLEHGKRILTAVIEQRAKDDASEPWLSVPVDETNLSMGYKDLTFWQLNNAANRAAYWMSENLPTGEPFQCFAYTGPKDLRYPILAVAAAKVQKVMVLPSPLVTPEAQLQILEKKGCTLYLRPDEMTEPVAGILKGTSHIKPITIPALEYFLNDTEASPSWAEGKDDPWLVFHTSGTTGNPKPVTYSHQMMAGVEVAASLPDIEETHIHQYAQRRWYTPLPSLHFVGMLMTLSMTTFVNMIAVIGPVGPPSPATVTEVLRHGRVEGALLPPVLIDALCLFPDGLEALKDLQYVHYAGASLSTKSTELLVPYTQVVPCVGSTEAGGYFTAIHGQINAWDYLAFQRHAGATFEQRLGDLHELVFIRNPECAMQQIFTHPTKKGLWKIIGRSDDYVCFSHGDGLHASLLEPEITAHPGVNNALIGGHGRQSPVLLVEFVEGAEDNGTREGLLKSLRPYIDKLNARCHASIRISPEKVIIASKDKMFITTIKGSVARLQTLRLYEDEIAALFT